MSHLPYSTCYSERVGNLRRGIQSRAFLFVRETADAPSRKIPNTILNPGEKTGAARRLLYLPMKKQCKVRPRINVAPRRSPKPRHAPSRKRQGELAELAFMHKAASLGFGVSKPYGDSDRFDFIVSWHGHLSRVQVKSTRVAHRQCYEISAHGCWGAHDIYTKDEIYFIIAYVVPEDTCYVIPIEATRGRKRLCLHPNVPHRECYRYEQYREAWWLMKPVAPVV
jgi:hypothetical protein